MTLTGLTIADLEAMPDDGRRFELIGGAIAMTPAPGLGHQRASHRLNISSTMAGHGSVRRIPDG